MTTKVSGAEGSVLLSWLCLVAGVLGGLLAVMNPLLGAALSVIALAWAIAGNRGIGHGKYRIALFVSLAALAMNGGVLLSSLSVGTYSPDPEPAVKIS